MGLTQPITKHDLEDMILAMRKGTSNVNIPLYKEAEVVRETYKDEELLTLLNKPKADNQKVTR